MIDSKKNGGGGGGEGVTLNDWSVINEYKSYKK